MRAMGVGGQQAVVWQSTGVGQPALKENVTLASCGSMVARRIGVRWSCNQGQRVWREISGLVQHDGHGERIVWGCRLNACYRERAVSPRKSDIVRRQAKRARVLEERKRQLAFHSRRSPRTSR